MGLKLGQKLNFRPFSSFCSISGRDVGRDIKSGCDVKSVATSGRDINYGRDIKSRHQFWPRHQICSRHHFLDSNWFFFTNLSGHNFFVLTRIWACEYSLEISLNVECSHEEI